MTQRQILEEQNPHSYLDAERRLTLKCHLKEGRDLAQGRVSCILFFMQWWTSNEDQLRLHERHCSQWPIDGRMCWL